MEIVYVHSMHVVLMAQQQQGKNRSVNKLIINCALHVQRAQNIFPFGFMRLLKNKLKTYANKKLH